MEVTNPDTAWVSLFSVMPRKEVGAGQVAPVVVALNAAATGAVVASVSDNVTATAAAGHASSTASAPAAATIYGFRPLRPHVMIDPGRRKRPFVYPK